MSFVVQKIADHAHYEGFPVHPTKTYLQVHTYYKFHEKNLKKTTSQLVKKNFNLRVIQKSTLIHWHHHFLRQYIWHFLCRNNVHLQVNMLPLFLPIFYSGFKLLLWNASKDHMGFLVHVDVCFKVMARQFTFQQWKLSLGVRSGMYGGCFIASVLWYLSHSCTRAAICGRALSWWRIHHWRNSGHFHWYDQGVFLVSSCNTSYLSMFLADTFWWTILR